MGIESENGNRGETHTHTRKGINGTNIGTYAKAMESIQFNMVTTKKHHNWVLGDIGCISHPLTLGSFLALPCINGASTGRYRKAIKSMHFTLPERQNALVHHMYAL